MIIYKITNLANNKMYIGQTIQKNPMIRFYKHLSHSKKGKNSLSNAIRKYGKYNFIFEIIACAKNLEDLNFLEKYFIYKYKTNIKKYGYNLTSGGEQPRLSSSTISKIKNTIKSQYSNGRKPWNYGLKYSFTSRDRSEYVFKKEMTLEEKNIIKRKNRSIGAIIRNKIHGNVSSKKVLCLELNLIFRSAAQAAKYFNTSQGHISNICRGERISYKGLKFLYTQKDYNITIL